MAHTADPVSGGPSPSLIDAPSNTVRARRLHDIAGLCIVLGFVVFTYCLCLSHIIFSGDPSKLVGIGDFHTLNGPKAYFLDLRLQRGEFPMWDPQTQTGIPYAAHPLTMSFYLPNIVRAIVTRPTSPMEFFYSLYAFVLFHALVVASGLYLLSRRERISIPSAIVLSVAAPFTETWLYESLDQMPMICTVAWTPYVLLCLRLAADQDVWRTRAGWTILAGAFYGTQILAGWPQAAIYLTVIYSVFIVTVFGMRALPRPLTLRALAGHLRPAASALVLFGMVGGLIGLALALPAAELIHLSARSSSNFKRFLTMDEVNVPSLVFAIAVAQRYGPGWVTWVHALFEEGDRWFSLNLGLCLVASASALLVRRPRVLLYFFLTALTVDLTFGWPMPVSTLFERLALFTISSPFYTTVIVTIPLAILAGFGLDALIQWGLKGPLPLRARILLVSLAIPLILLGSEPPDYLPVQHLTWSLMPAAIVALIAFGRGMRQWHTLVIAALLAEIALCAIPIIEVCFSRPSFMKPLFMSDPKVLSTQTNSGLRGVRIVCKQSNHQIWAGENAVNGFDPLTLYSAFEPLASPGAESAYSRGMPVEKNLRIASLFKRPIWLSSAFVRGPLPEKTRLFPPAAAVFLDVPGPLSLPERRLEEIPVSSISRPGEELELSPQSPGPSAFASPTAQILVVPEMPLPKRNHAIRVYYRTSSDTTLSVRTLGAAGPLQRFSVGPIALAATGERPEVFEMPLPDFDKAAIEITMQSSQPLPPDVVTRLALIEDLDDEQDRLEIEKNSANTLILTARELPGPRALVLTEMNYPGWSATVDGASAPILPADGPYKAVVVPAGTHRIAFYFRPWRVLVGAPISAIAFILSLSAAAILLFRRPS